MRDLVIAGEVRRTILVVLDGLRPDAISEFGLENVTRLAQNGAATFEGTTVNPSVTAAAMASLLTGAEPTRQSGLIVLHWVDADRAGDDSRRTGRSVPRELRRQVLDANPRGHTDV